MKLDSGPLGVPLNVRECMLYDLGSRDEKFMETIKYIRERLLIIANVSADDFTAIPVQGSGTYCVEAVLQTIATHQNTDATVLIIENGTYGQRIAAICAAAKIPHEVMKCHEGSQIDEEKVRCYLENHYNEGKTAYRMVCAVHCETSSGVFNPVEIIGNHVKSYCPNTIYFVDAMSSFGGVPLDLNTGRIDVMVSSANKCLEGVPGFGFVIARCDLLQQCRGSCRSLSLDLEAQARALDTNGQFRFTPPTHAILAFRQALLNFQEEGLEGRAKRYKENNKILKDGMRKFGFREVLPLDDLSYVITSFYYPKHKNFTFQEFYKRLNNQGFVIYPGKVSKLASFRIGNIGHLYPADMHNLLSAIAEIMLHMCIKLPLGKDEN